MEDGGKKRLLNESRRQGSDVRGRPLGLLAPQPSCGVPRTCTASSTTAPAPALHPRPRWLCAVLIFCAPGLLQCIVALARAASATAASSHSSLPATQQPSQSFTQHEQHRWSAHGSIPQRACKSAFSCPPAHPSHALLALVPCVGRAGADRGVGDQPLEELGQPPAAAALHPPSASVRGGWRSSLTCSPRRTPGSCCVRCVRW